VIPSAASGVHRCGNPGDDRKAFVVEGADCRVDFGALELHPDS
jgi:hypothetical protein